MKAFILRPSRPFTACSEDMAFEPNGSLPDEPMSLEPASCIKRARRIECGAGISRYGLRQCVAPTCTCISYGCLEPTHRCWKIADQGSAELAAQLVCKACRDNNVDPRGLVLHSDNGKPMRGNTMITTLQRLGVVPSFSRPHVSDDNPYSEALFRTLKYTPAYPRLPFADLRAAQGWVGHFVGWYNGVHRHSAIRYVTPDERHSGPENAVLERRRVLYEQARTAAPRRWTRATRNWSAVRQVVLNPQRSTGVATAHQMRQLS